MRDDGRRSRASTVLRGSWAGLVAWSVLGVACGPADSDPGSWSGEVRDSAGVVIVRNAPSSSAVPALWRVEQLLSVGGAEALDGPSFGNVADAALHHDTVYVLDGPAQRISVFDPSGVRVRDIGGPGDGPGELSRFASSLLLAGDTVLVVDWGRGRIHRFLEDGTFLDAPLLDSGGDRSWWRLAADGEIYFRRLGPFVDQERWRGDDVLVHAPGIAGSYDVAASPALPIDTVFRFVYDETDVGGPGRPSLPLVVNTPSWDVLPDGRIAWTSLEDAEVRIHQPGGALARIVRSDEWARRPLGAEDEAALLRLMGDKLVALGGSRSTVEELGARQPELLPAITTVRAGPGSTIWAQRMGSTEDVHPSALNSPDPPIGWGGARWDVLDAEGRLLGAVDLGPRVRVLRITEDRILGVRWDELGREAVVVWGLVEREG